MADKKSPADADGVHRPFPIDDVIISTDSGRVSVRLTGEGYRKTETMDYWEGEEG
jgi:hypothetical protein